MIIYVNKKMCGICNLEHDGVILKRNDYTDVGLSNYIQCVANEKCTEGFSILFRIFKLQMKDPFYMNLILSLAPSSVYLKYCRMLKNYKFKFDDPQSLHCACKHKKFVLTNYIIKNSNIKSWRIIGEYKEFRKELVKYNNRYKYVH